ncbi:MAG: aldehyde dehydrogenase family protein [Verrucomicrobiales bacterium]|nr:aldehyde dehydrogenase family protein [Verrucomicrobiales bacterium]
MHPAIQAQKEFFATGVTRDVGYRRGALQRLIARLAAREDALLAALDEDVGKPSLEAYVSEVYFTRQEARFALKHLRRWTRPRRVRPSVFSLPSRCEIRPEPYGQVLILGPWNYPFQLVMGPLVSAVAAGNCVVVKPSELAPATSAFLARFVLECFDPRHVTVLEGDAAVAQGLLAEPFDYVFYTGSTAIGREVMRACADRLVPVTLELGGKSPCLVDGSVDLDVAVRRIARGKFFNAGQTCVAPDFVCVPQALLAPFCDRLLRTIRGFYGANPRGSPDYARIVSARHFDRLTALLPRGAESVGEHDRARRFFAPTLVRNPAWTERLMQEEIFGPILPCLAYDDIGYVLAEIRRRPAPLALYVFSTNDAFRERCVREVPSGGVCLNDTMLHLTPLALPFGGVGDSGMGRYHGKHGFDTFTHERSVMRRSPRFDFFGVLPPYGRVLERIKPFLGGRRR